MTTREPVGGCRADRERMLAALGEDPRPAVSRAALAAGHLRWGLTTLSLLAVGLVVGFGSLGPLGRAADVCRTRPDPLVCRPGVHAAVVALPVVGLLVGLAVSLVGGRLAIRRGRSPMLPATLGWIVCGLGTAAAFLLAAAS
jgi:hypothetical protein